MKQVAPRHNNALFGSGARNLGQAAPFPAKLRPVVGDVRPDIGHMAPYSCGQGDSAGHFEETETPSSESS